MRRNQFLLLAAAFILTTTTASSQVAPNSSDPGVARISIVTGDVSVQRGDAGERTAAAVNAPLAAGDIVDTGEGGHTEIQLDSANIVRLASDSEVRLTDLAGGRYQLQVGRGTVMFSVLRDSRAQVEVSTPAVSMRPLQRGEYRVSVYDDGRAEITVRSGEADIYGPRGSERLNAGRTMMVRGNPEDPEFQIVGAIQPDEFDRWNQNRDRNLEQSRSYQYVSPEINGAQDLDGYGRWTTDPSYGQVWVPNVGPDWAPYRYGRWVWEDYYGWTWVDYDPWGWAPFHYGRWFWGAPGWCWYPGPIYGPHYWSPALVAFFGFGGFHVGIGFGGPGFGWVPLAPFEVCHPWWGHGFYGGYRNHNVLVNNINVVNNVNITNIYRNARVNNGVTVVNGHDFANGRFTNALHVTPAQLQQASLVKGQVPMAPTNSSLRFSNRAVTIPERNSGFTNGRFFSHNAPAPVNRVPFAQQQQSLAQISRSGGVMRPGTASSMPSAQAGRAENAARMPSASNAMRQGSAAPAPTGGWRRLNEPQQNAAPAPPRYSVEPRGANAPRPSVNEPSRSWGRFGTPAPRGNGWNTPGDRPATAPSYRVTPSDGWRRYQPSTERPAYSAPQYQSPRSLQIAPPIVRERAMPRSQPSYGGSGGGHSAPRQSAPSGGGHGGGGGGSGAGSRGGGGGGHHGR